MHLWQSNLNKLPYVRPAVENATSPDFQGLRVDQIASRSVGVAFKSGLTRFFGCLNSPHFYYSQTASQGINPFSL